MVGKMNWFQMTGNKISLSRYPKRATQVTVTIGEVSHFSQSLEKCYILAYSKDSKTRLNNVCVKNKVDLEKVAQIFSLQNIIEQSKEYQKWVTMNFTDFKKHLTLSIENHYETDYKHMVSPRDTLTSLKTFTRRLGAV